MSKIVVIGSLNMDLVIQTTYMPEMGETLIGHSFETIPGGKGANQAAACARLGGDVTIIGRVGNDEFGEALTKSMKSFGVNTDGLMVDPNERSGIAMIVVAQGDNMIVLSEGANAKVSIADIESKKELIDEAEIILLQFEIPLETIRYVIKKYKDSKKIFLNPAPFRAVDDSMLRGLYTLVPNENEAEKLCGIKIDSEERAFEALEMLKEKGVLNPIITLGEKGAAYFDGQVGKIMPANKVTPLDTTAAGDTFLGALAVARLEGKKIDDSVEFAQKAAALAVSKYGAQTSIPSRKEVESFAKS